MNCQENKPKLNNATLFVAALSVCLGFALLGVSPQVLAFQLETTENVRILRTNQDCEFSFEDEADDDLTPSENYLKNGISANCETASSRSSQARAENLPTRNVWQNAPQTFIETALAHFHNSFLDITSDAPKPPDDNSSVLSAQTVNDFFAETFAQRLFQIPATRARGSI